MDNPTYNEFARPGDPNFEAFPRHLSDDTVYYSVHLLWPNSSISPQQARMQLSQVRKASLDISHELLKDYIWQCEVFSLSLFAETPEPYLSGKTEFGDAIADEWLVVYLLRELSKKFKDIWVRVFDADGEFLLIEAANALPKWLVPEVAEYRVWLNQGQLRIIPRDVVSKSAASAGHSLKTISKEDALSYLKDKPSSLIHSPMIEEEAFYRLHNYPKQISDSLHTAIALIPRKLAYILRHTPAHISSAVDAFYLRDPISLRPLLRSTKPLHFPPNDLVLVSVKFTRVGYAQLKSQEFTTPQAWVSAMREHQGDGPRAEIGMKVSCGFEMLVADLQNKGKRAVREINILLDDLDTGNAKLPSNAEIESWPRVEDNERWLDINFQDFENELSGRDHNEKIREVPGDFGDKNAQENLRKIVERFEEFLNDDEEASNSDMDSDNEESEDEDESSRVGEDEAVSFDDEQFEEAMREMMGLSPMREESMTNDTGRDRVARGKMTADSADGDGGDDEDEAAEIKKLAAQMEAELEEFGALNLDHIGGGSKSISSADTRVGEEDEQYLLAKNFLEAFRGQAGASGPAGNLMSMFGVMMPRDDSDGE